MAVSELLGHATLKVQQHGNLWDLILVMFQRMINLTNAGHSLRCTTPTAFCHNAAPEQPPVLHLASLQLGTAGVFYRCWQHTTTREREKVADVRGSNACTSSWLCAEQRLLRSFTEAACCVFRHEPALLESIRSRVRDQNMQGAIQPCQMSCVLCQRSDGLYMTR